MLFGLFFLTIVSGAFGLSSGKGQWSVLDALLEEGVKNGTFPGAVGMVGTRDEILYVHAVGHFTYGKFNPPRDAYNPAVTRTTRYDMASCTKVMATTTAAALLYQQGYFDILDPVSKYLGVAYNQQGKENVKIVNCLTHDAGYPPDPTPDYWNSTFKCPETAKDHPQLSWDCNAKIFASLLNQTLARPPGVAYVYSDLSFITMHYIIGAIVVQNNIVVAPLLEECAHFSVDSNPGGSYLCHYEAFVRKMFSETLKMPNSNFLPKSATWGTFPPTRNDTWYRHAVSQGTVDDGNAYALGGVSGHAGLFSSADDIQTLMKTWLYSEEPQLINETTRKLWITEYNHSISCRALGWSTNDQTVVDRGWDGLCGNLSNRTFLHVGYTGTQICADPERKLFTVLLANRVYPTGANLKIEDFRRTWNDKIVDLFDGTNKCQWSPTKG